VHGVHSFGWLTSTSGNSTGPSFCHQHTAGVLGLGQVLMRCQCRLVAGESVRQSVLCFRYGLLVLISGVTGCCGTSLQAPYGSVRVRAVSIV
jgi:hypothetical protein